MVKKTHLQGGVLVSLLTNPIVLGTIPAVDDIIYRIILTCVYIAGSCTGSLLPDIDMKSSYISKTVPMLHRIYGKRFKHRGFTHSLLALFLLYIWTSIITRFVDGEPGISLFVYGVFVGCVSHIFLDLFTKEGVNLFSPIGKTISFTNLKTSSRKEKKLNKYLDFAIYMVLGANIYIGLHYVGLSIIGSVNNISVILKN